MKVEGELPVTKNYHRGSAVAPCQPRQEELARQENSGGTYFSAEMFFSNELQGVWIFTVVVMLIE